MDACNWSEEKVRQICVDCFSASPQVAKQTGPKLLAGGATVNLAQKVQDMKIVTDFGEKRGDKSLVNQDQLANDKARKERRLQKKEDRKKFGAAKTTAESMMRNRNAKNQLQVVKDIKIENFDINVGGRRLLENAYLTLTFGRKYGLVGRNGIGKSSLLKAISARDIPIPDHIHILHVEQEVTGDDTRAIDSVLEADVERKNLLQEEKDILASTDTDAAVKKANDEKLSQIYARLDTIEADKAEPRASAILAGLGFTGEMQQRPTKEFSGGWRMRLALARALFCEPDLLLLDEPTNMLDIKAVLWLEAYLAKWKSTILVVSHDRDFLNVMASDIIHFANQTLATYRGNYDTFEKTRSEKLKSQQRAHEAQDQHRKHVQAFIDRFRYNAKRASLVQSRLKMLNKMEVIPSVIEDPTIAFSFPEPDQLSPPLIQFNDVTFKYGSDRQIFGNLNFGMDMESRVAIVGSNGTGKTTLLKLVTGELSPTTGYVFRNPRLRLARFSQHHVDQLELDVSALEFFASTFPGKEPLFYRSHLGSYGITGNLALQPMDTLSGGQKSRVAFAVLAMKQPHFLILDEPTNHLDLDTVDILSQALNTYSGGVLLVTHDQRLLTLCCNEMWIVADQKVTPFEGDFENYRKTLGVENV